MYRKKTLAAFVAVMLLYVVGAQAKTLEAYFSYCTFYSPQTGPYVETYLSMKGSSVHYAKNDNGMWQGSVEVTYIFRQGEEVKNFKKFNLLSPELEDTTAGFVNFLDQQRIVLPNGDYTFEIALADNQGPGEPFNDQLDMTVDYPNSRVGISEIQLVESYEKSENPTILTKSGYDLVPFVTDFFPTSIERLTFYCEIYNSDYVLGEDAMYLINYYIESTNHPGEALQSFRGFVRQKAGKVDVLLNEFNIKTLSSGNYNLVVEARDRTNEIISERRIFFQRSNPAVPLTMEEVSALKTSDSFVDRITSRDTLVEFIRSTRPISSELETAFADQQLKKAEFTLLKQFFLGFWTNRNVTDPEREWLEYKQEVAKVEKEFRTSIKKGYETDRGRVYLQYGPPNTMVARRNEPTTYPYEIWHYYKLDARSDAKFIFYNTDLGTNDYELLHSNVRGEKMDYRWQVRLRNRSEQINNVDTEQGSDSWGSEADDLWKMPR